MKWENDIISAPPPQKGKKTKKKNLSIEVVNDFDERQNSPGPTPPTTTMSEYNYNNKSLLHMELKRIYLEADLLKFLRSFF